MRTHHVLMVGAALVLIVVTGIGIAGGALATLLLVGLLLLCPLMMLGMHGAGRAHGDEQGADGPDVPGSPHEGVGRRGR